MSDYKMRRTEDGRAFELWQGDEKVRTFVDPILPISVQDSLNMETAPLHARIAELEAALEMNLDASSDIAEDESIDAMRGRLQSIRAKSIHALKKAGDHD